MIDEPTRLNPSALDRAPRPARRALHVAPDPTEMDLAAAEAAVTSLLEAFGADPTNEHLADTPRRVAAAYAEMVAKTTTSALSGPVREDVRTRSEFLALAQGKVT